MALKIKGIKLETKKEKKMIHCPICKKPVFVNSGDTHYDHYIFSYNVNDKKNERNKCEHICCELSINRYEFNKVPDNWELISGIKLLPNLQTENIQNVKDAKKFIAERKPDYVVFTKDEFDKHSYFFFKSEGFGYFDK